jgi:hypothetical protein
MLCIRFCPKTGCDNQIPIMGGHHEHVQHGTTKYGIVEQVKLSDDEFHIFCVEIHMLAS